MPHSQPQFPYPHHDYQEDISPIPQSVKRIRQQSYPQHNQPMAMASILPEKQIIPVVEQPTFEFNGQGKVKAMIIRITYPDN